jgi:hypothetical protein
MTAQYKRIPLNSEQAKGLLRFERRAKLILSLLLMLGMSFGVAGAIFIALFLLLFCYDHLSLRQRIKRGTFGLKKDDAERYDSFKASLAH